ncbi:murein DD-endopeptidase MepM/ murein hydrolase activator NlpD [Novosphingobium kunmingense]|uniref:Murein DD-endopeptidase MepM/ murein hydrolase activator NlpD n=1 Tax=Novosphingobium kunmingense TaxID=1211806 RepID=A0A2N0HKF2_9SPHN|nr:M23 family metallopeptidase [Novosphingobium kunmingense]PKB19427.1 murein DD-endopeptidase MepM/ murein hydrolase activator NlpD [Novosphingobium kunmingense]
MGTRAALLLTAGALLLAAADDPKVATSHTVKAGETLGGIANRAEVPRVLIIEANGLKAPYALRTGQKLVIPRRRTHTVKDGETGFGIAMDFGVPWSQIALASGVNPKAPVRTGQKLTIPTLARAAVAAAPSVPVEADGDVPAFRWPVTGPVRRAFAAQGSGKTGHDGIDVLADKGTAIRAAAAGKVIYAGEGPKEYGKTVILFHGGRWTTTYSYLDAITVTDGEEVRSGQRIGLNGETGLAAQPQLHFEIRRNRVPLDPAKYLPQDKP